MPFPSNDSLYAVLMADSVFAGEMEKLAMTAPRYNDLQKNKLLKNAVIAERLFKSTSHASLVKNLTECGNAAEFQKKFEGAIDKVDPKELYPVLTLKAFPETYFHPKIALALHASGKLTKDSNTLRDRVQETGEVMFSKESRRLATALMVGLSHTFRRSTYVKKGEYIEETVAYTLLTFSWFGAKAAGGKSADWYYYWRIFGSLMGLPKERLPDDDKTAMAKMQEIHKSLPKTDKLSKEQHELLDLYVETFKTDLLEAYNQMPTLLSSRMVEYMKSKGYVTKDKKELKSK